ncbi:MAG TPA: translation elongation factor 4 [Polyangia bacterium]|nr:translation elongation factor 4 [Polyangia bacterium]
MSTPTHLIRNFSIIAHIDHGKSTLADRLLDATEALTSRERRAQFMDSMDLERERGITIKAATVRLSYLADDGKTYELNLIDTPGHVDFHYEVSRSLAACEGAVLVVDASQGVEAQTLANVYLAVNLNLTIVPVINKIDLPAADPENARREIEEVVGIDATEAVLASAKEGIGIREILEQIVKKVPPPVGDPEAPLKVLLLDSWYDTYRGVVILVRVVDGVMKPKQKVLFMSVRREYELQTVGAFAPFAREVPELGPGEVGFFTAAIKDVGDARVGDTITELARPCAEPLEGFKPAKPMVFAGIFPTDTARYEDLRDALDKLRLNDSSFTREPETSAALGFGFRCGFLGLLHMEIVQERLEREYNLDLITTAPTVRFRCILQNNDVIELDNPAKFPQDGGLERIEEPIIAATIHTPPEYVGAILKLCEDKRGTQTGLTYAGDKRVIIRYDLPLTEMVFGFYDRLKSASRGYASLDYEPKDYKPADLVRMDLLVNGDRVDSLSLIVHRETAYNKGRDLCGKMKELIPQQQFEVAIQASIGSRVIARTTVKALRKNVTAKCYGGDITRKRKLLERQKEGKKRMKQVGNVEIPQEAFLAILKVD